MKRRTRTGHWLLTAGVAVALSACGGDEGGGGSNGAGAGNTTNVGTFDGLFDDVVTGLNYAFDIAIVPFDELLDDDDVLEGDILLANYGTSEIFVADDPGGGASGQNASTFFDGASEGLAGPMAVSATPDGVVWAAFEQGGDGDDGGIAVLDESGQLLTVIDGSAQAGAFAEPSGLCYGGQASPSAAVLFFMVNKGDGSAWRIEVDSSRGENPVLTLVGSGLATGTRGTPGTPPDGVGNKNDLPEGGARGCAYLDGYLYVADAQNAQVVRFEDADTLSGIAGVALEDTPPDLVTHPTGVTINAEGALIVISSDNAHAFVALDIPSGAFRDNGLHDLNVNSGNFGVQVGDGTIWFTRANNANGALRAVTPDQQTPPSSGGTFPAQ